MRICKEVADFSFWETLQSAGAVFVFLFVVVCLCNVAWHSAGKVDYCYVAHASSEIPGASTYVVYGHVPWSSDNKVGHAKDASEAFMISRTQCPVVR
jgi:hypothetical protein